MLHIQIISPVAVLYEGNVEYAVFPGAKGAFAVYKDHAPIVSLLKAGDIRCIEDKTHEETITVKGGFVEVCNNKMVVCVEQ